MSENSAPTEYFTGIIFNPDNFPSSSSSVDLNYLQSNYLQKVGFPISNASSTTFNGDLIVNGNFTNSSITSIDASLNVIYTSLSNMVNSINGLGSEYSILYSNVNTINSHLILTDSSFNSINSSIKTLNSGLSGANSNISSLTSSVTTINNHLVLTDSSFNSLNSSITGINSHLGNVDSSFNSLTTSLATTNSNVTTNANNIASNTSSISTLTSGLSGANSNISSLTSSLATTNSNVTTNANNIASNTSSISTLTSGLSGANSNISSLTSSVSTINSHLTLTDASLNTLSTNTYPISWVTHSTYNDLYINSNILTGGNFLNIGVGDAVFMNNATSTPSNYTSSLVTDASGNGSAVTILTLNFHRYEYIGQCLLTPTYDFYKYIYSYTTTLGSVQNFVHTLNSVTFTIYRNSILVNTIINYPNYTMSFAPPNVAFYSGYVYTNISYALTDTAVAIISDTYMDNDYQYVVKAQMSVTNTQTYGRNGAQAAQSSSYFLLNSSTTASTVSFTSGRNNLTNGLNGNLYLNEIHSNAHYCSTMSANSFFVYLCSFNCNTNGGGSATTVLLTTYSLSAGYYKFFVMYSTSSSNSVISNINQIVNFELYYDSSSSVGIFNTTFFSGSWSVTSTVNGFIISCSTTSSYTNFNCYRMKLF